LQPLERRVVLFATFQLSYNVASRCERPLGERRAAASCVQQTAVVGRSCRCSRLLRNPLWRMLVFDDDDLTVLTVVLGAISGLSEDGKRAVQVRFILRNVPVFSSRSSVHQTWSS